MEFELLGRHSRLVKEIRSLSSHSERLEKGLFVVEGIRVIEELIASKVRIMHLLVAERLLNSDVTVWAEEVKAQQSGVKIWIAADSVMEDISSTKSDQGILAVAEMPQVGSKDILRNDKLLVLSQVQDPGNVGTLIRSALAFGFQAVLACGGADPFNARAVRSSAGAVFHLPVLHCGDDELEEWCQRLVKEEFALITAEAHGGLSINKVKFPKRMALVLGAEVKGVDRSWQNEAHIKVHIPLEAKSESLNVAAAGAIIMFKTTC